MTEPGKWRNGLQPQVADEIEYIKRAFRDPPRRKGADPLPGKDIVAIATSDGGLDFMYAEGELLVRDEYFDRVLEILEHPSRRELEQAGPNPVQRVIAGVILLTDLGRFPTTLAALAAIDGQLGRGIATPNHVMTVAGGVGSSCPATEPEEVYYDIEPFPSVCPDGGGAGVLIYMADTGLLRDSATHSWLAGVQMEDPVLDADPLSPLTGNPPAIPAYTGHGTFVAGVARCMAPAAEIIVTNAFLIAGSVLESDLVPRLEAALSLGVDIFHLTVACLSRYDLPLISFLEWLRRLRQYGGVVCIAAAGNSGFRRPTWPAAFSEVISVGALGGDWRGRASFSNFGGWVDVYAPGRDLINAYPTGKYTCHVSPYDTQVRSFYGMAKWSGTSFSTPIVTGLIAARMSRTGDNSQQAAAALLAEARHQAIPGVGPVLLPCCHSGTAAVCRDVPGASCCGPEPRPARHLPHPPPLR
jgi:Subtilase family